MSETRIILRGGTVVDGTGVGPRIADLVMRRRVIEAVGTVTVEPDDVVVDVTNRYLMPGFIDTHSHADAAVFSTEVQRSLLRQGVTTVIVGQDGISYAPGDGAYATEYFGALIGSHPSYRGGGVRELLASYDETTPINVGYLVPAGTVRNAVRGYSAGPSTPTELMAMSELVAGGLEEGALGLSTGLDYVPNIYADTTELIALCRPVAASGGIYVSHMRSGPDSNSRVGTDEVSKLAIATGMSVHISHYQGPSDLLIARIDEMTSRGINVTFDAYPYRRGFTLLAKPTLPPELLSGSHAEVVKKLSDPGLRENLLSNWFPSLDTSSKMGPEWPDNLTLAHITAPDYKWAESLTIRIAAERVGHDPASFTLELLIASSLDVSVVQKIRYQRTYDDLAKLFTHPAHVAGSDGIFIGTHPHPRAWGTFAKYLRVFTRERSDFSWAEAAVHLSGRSAQRFGLSGYGELRPGYSADVVVVDPQRVRDTSDYVAPRSDAVGIDDVFVGGKQVLAAGELTGVVSGRSLRRPKFIH